MKKDENVIRVAQVIGKTVSGGVEAVVLNYYRNIDKSKVQFDFFVDADSTVSINEEVEELGGRVFIIPPYQRIFPHMRALIRLFKQNRYKIVHSNMNTMSVFSLMAAWLARVPVRIVHNHSTAAKGETKKNIMKYTLRPFAKVFATHYFACSNLAAEWIFGKKFCNSGKVRIINNAIDLDKFKFSENIRHKKRYELGLKDEFVVGHVGRFCYQKNHEFLIDIFAELQKKCNNSRLLLVGDGPDFESVKAKVDSLGLDDKVIFLGNRNDVHELYQAMDVFVLPSRYEGLPVVAVEAQAVGLPCVLSENITKEIKVTSACVNADINNTPQHWADVILKFKDYPRALDEVELVRNKYDIFGEAGRLCDMYEGMVSS